MTDRSPTPNPFLTAPLAAVFAKTALPIILVMSMSGLLNVVDAIFLGLFVGPEAVGAVTVIFPMTMILIAAATLVASGMSSLLARRLGSGDGDGARQVFAGAHGLAAMAALALAAGFALFGRGAADAAAGGGGAVADMAYAYAGISVAAAPLMFFLSIQSDALRNEGRAPMMAGLSVLVSLANMAFNYLLIAVFDLGVAGSALGTVAAQLVAISMVVVFRLRARTPLPLSALRTCSWRADWARIIALGAPPSLSFLGMALVSAAIIAAVQVQVQGGAAYPAVIAAYGIITRIMGFAFLPLLGLGMAMQTIVGHNVGAGRHARSDAALRAALLTAGAYCLAAEAIFQTRASAVGAMVVADPAVIAEVARILPQVTLLYAFVGPMLMLASYFQALGDAPRAALVSLTKPFAVAPALILALGAAFGEPGIWMASPGADAVMLGVTALVLAQAARSTGRRKGVFLAG